MQMNKEMLIDLQVKAISALMAKLGMTEITLTDEDVQAAPKLLGIDDDEIEMAYSYRPHAGFLTLTMSKPE